MKYQLKISGKHYKQVKEHLFPGDGKEAVAVALCGRHKQDNLSVLLVHKIELIPHNECTREPDFINWKTERIIPLLELAEKRNMAILKIHSHPNGYPHFSEIDNKSDEELFKSVFGKCESDDVHGSAIMLPDGRIFGRVFKPDLKCHNLDKITLAGDEIKIWRKQNDYKFDDASLRTRQLFGNGTYRKLKEMKIGVVGCSGTGSPTIEQLARYGVGKLVIVDPDKVEKKNLNRILNTTLKHANEGRYKVDVLKEAIESFGLGTKVNAFSKNLYDSKEAIDELTTCDVVFGCVDTVDGRELLNKLSTFDLIPYFDIGVRLDADGKGGVDNIYASVHFIQPGLSSLRSRGVYNSEELFADGLLRQDPEEFTKREKEGYVKKANVDRPAVISVNMQISTFTVLDFLNRIHGFKDDAFERFARITLDNIWSTIEYTPESSFKVDEGLAKWCGYGDCKPYLRLIELDDQWN